MRNNLILSVVLIGLLGITYYVEEIYKVENHEKSKSFVFKNLDNLTKIEFNYGTLEKLNENEWKLQEVNWKISQFKVEQLLDVLENLVIVREVKNNKENFFKNSFKLRLNFNEQLRKDIIFGDISSITGNFYLKDNMRNKTYLVQDLSSYKKAYATELDLKYRKYERIKFYLSFPESIMDLRIIGPNLLERTQSIAVKSTRNRNFEIDLVKNEINPHPLEKVEIKNLRKEIDLAFSNAMALKWHREDKIVLTDKRSELIFKTVDEKIKTYTLFLGLNNRYGYYIKDHENQLVFELDKINAMGFFMNSQDFLNKAINYKTDFTNIDILKFSIIKEQKEFEFFVDNLEKFEVKTKNPNINFISKTHMNFLFNLILNLADFRQAKYILEQSKLDNPDLEINILDKTLKIKIESNEILVLDVKEGLLFHYAYNFNQVKPGFFRDLFNVEK